MRDNQKLRKVLISASFILGGIAWLVGTYAEQYQMEDAVKEEVEKQLAALNKGDV